MFLLIRAIIKTAAAADRSIKVQTIITHFLNYFPTTKPLEQAVFCVSNIILYFLNFFNNYKDIL